MLILFLFLLIFSFVLLSSSGEHELVAGDRITEKELSEKLKDQVEEEEERQKENKNQEPRKKILTLIGENENNEVVGCCAVKPWGEKQV